MARRIDDPWDPPDPSEGGYVPPVPIGSTDPALRKGQYGAAVPFILGTARCKPQVVYWGPPITWNTGRKSGDVPYIADPATNLLRSYVGTINPAVYLVCEAAITAITKLYHSHFGNGVAPDDALVRTLRGTQEIVTGATPNAWAGYAGTVAEGMAHRGSAQIRMTHCFSAEGGVPREFDAEVQGYGAGASGESSTGDAHPADILTYLLTDGKNGLGLPSSMIEVDKGFGTTDGERTASSFRRYCSVRGWYMSRAFVEREAITDAISSLLLACDATLVLIDGKMTAIPYGDKEITRTIGGSAVTFTPYLTPFVIDAAELIHDPEEPPIEVERRQEKDIFGVWPVSYVDRDSGYKTLLREYIDPVWTSQYGARRADETQLPWVMSAAQAGWVTHMLAQRAIYQRNTYKFKVGARWSLLTPLDFVSLTEPTLGIASVTARIVSVEQNDDLSLSIEAIEWPSNAAEPIDLTPQTADGLSEWRPTPVAGGAPEAPAVGGGNLLANSRLYDAAGGFAPWTKETSGDTAAAQATGAPDGAGYQRLSWTATNAKHGWRPAVAGLLRVGADYAISFYARADANLSTGFEVTADVSPAEVVAIENPNLTTSWQRYVFRAYWDPTVPTSYAILRTAAVIAAAGSLDFACAQIEEGSLPTGYQPRGGEILPGSVGHDRVTPSNIDKDNLFPNPSSEVAPIAGADPTAPEWAGRYEGDAYAGSWVRRVRAAMIGIWVPCAPGARFYMEAMGKRESGSSGYGQRLRIAFFDSLGGDPTRTPLAYHESDTAIPSAWTKFSVASAEAPSGAVAAWIGIDGQASTDYYHWDSLYARRVVSEAVQGSESVAMSATYWDGSVGVSIRKVGGLVVGYFTGTANGAMTWTIATLPAGARPLTAMEITGLFTDASGNVIPATFQIATNGNIVMRTFLSTTTHVFTNVAGQPNAACIAGLSFVFPYL